MDPDPKASTSSGADPAKPTSSGPGGSSSVLGTAPTVRSSRVAGFSFTRSRVLQVVAIVAALVLGSLLPYLAMTYVTFTVTIDRFAASLFPAAQFVRGIDPTWLPGYEPGPAAERVQLALTVINLGPSLQQIGMVVALLTCASLFQDEINKFFWWPLHLSGWMLALAPVPLLVGDRLLGQADVEVGIGPGWVPLAVAGLMILAATFRARNRIDSYGSI